MYTFTALLTAEIASTFSFLVKRAIQLSSKQLNTKQIEKYHAYM